jgi:zinc transporter ZupT
MNTVTVMLKSGNTLKSSLRMLMLDAVTPVIGAIVSLFVTSVDHYLVYLLPFFAGGFLYLGASDLLPEAHDEISPSMAFGISLVGFLVVFIASKLLTF